MVKPAGGVAIAVGGAVATDVDRLHQVAEEAIRQGRELGAAVWHAALTELRGHLHRPMSLADTERIEAVAKLYLRAIFRRQVNDDDARFLAQWQRDLGFLLKYKSYGIKCATPLGYSVFLLNPGEGFSFQRHVTRKTEVFHILEPLERALVFLCSSDEWNAVYERGRFDRWLAGENDEELDCIAVRPRPGDVFPVSELGVVHTVLGCILEEFATVSTDMVERLHDQNAGRSEPHVARETVMERLRRVPVCTPRVDAESRKNARIYTLASGVMDATRVRATRGRFDLRRDENRARVLYMVDGAASFTLGATEPIDARAGELLMIAPGIDTAVEVSDTAAFSMQGIEPEVALA
jgi:uncharacterized cupin superfamily protein